MIFNAFERLVALRYLRPRRQTGFISVIALFSLLGIALGVATLITVMAIMNGFRDELLSRILGANGHLVVSSYEGPIEDYQGLAERLSAIDGVASAVPQIHGTVMVAAGESATGAEVRAMRPEDLKGRALVAENIREGSIDAMADGESILIGTRMATNLGVGVGDKITLILPRGNVTALGMVPRLKTYRIAGLFELGMYIYDNSYIYAPLEAAQTFFRLPERVNTIEIFARDPTQVRRIETAAVPIVGGGFSIRDWQRATTGYFATIEVERNVMFLILTMIIVVAALNIISGQIMMVKDKGRDIAILRTMGTTQRTVMRIFLLSGASIGLIGTLLGMVLALAFTSNIERIRVWLEDFTGMTIFDPTIYFLSQLPVRIDPLEVAAVVAMALGLCFLATVYPAWRAARLDPVEALRYE